MAYITTDKGVITLCNITNVVEFDKIEDGKVWVYYTVNNVLSQEHTDIFSLIPYSRAEEYQRITAINGNYINAQHEDTPSGSNLYPYKYAMLLSDDSFVVHDTGGNDSYLGESELLLMYAEIGGTVYFRFRTIQNSGGRYYDAFDIETSELISEWIERGAGDPYEEGGISGTGGGSGTFDGTGDAIGFPSLPTLSAVSTGFVTLYAPTLAQLNGLASYMWSGGFDIDTFRKLFADPMDVILGLSIVPVAVPISGAQDVKVGNISTGISMNKASTQYVNVDCGSLQVKEYWGSCLDYAPNSKCQIFLPYIGTRSIDIDEIMGKTIHVKYAVDILSGALVANIMCGSSVLYSFTGACASSIPVVSRDFTSIISSAIQIAGNIGMAVATGGLSTPVTAASAVQLGVAAGQTAMNVANSKPSVQHSGAVGGTSGMLSVQTPYLIFELPRQSLPKGYNTFGGYPANITLQLGTCSGFTKVEMIHLENIPATDAELNEIETLLKAGVIL